MPVGVVKRSWESQKKKKKTAGGRKATDACAMCTFFVAAVANLYIWGLEPNL